MLCRWFPLALATLLMGAENPSPPPLTAATLSGVWDADVTIGDDLRGPVTLAGERAGLGGFEAVETSKPGESIYAFGERGTLHVKVLASGDPIAFWVQPATISGATYATPVTLQAIARNVWRGDVDPLPNVVRMSLHVERGPSGAVTAFLRDPLYNLGRRLGSMTVTVTGSSLTLTGNDAPLSGTVDGPDTFALAFPKESGVPPVTFVRRANGNAASPAVTYREPLPTGDGWDIADAADAGLAVSGLESLQSFAAATTSPESPNSPAIHSIQIARHGKLVFDEYFDGFGEATLHDMRSAGKTYADVLAGAAMEAGVPLTAATTVLPFFSHDAATANRDPRKSAITLGNALSMSTGLDCDDNDDHSPANEDTVQNQSAQSDWNRLLLDTRIVRDPGTKAVYCSLSINLAGATIAAATKAWLPAYFAEHVAMPMQMQRYALNLAPGGNWYLGGGSYVRPRDFLKIGQVFLDGGTWHDRRIVPATWVSDSWNPRLSLGEGDGYGYAWHVRSYDLAGTSYTAYEAQGNGGQILDVIPRLDLVVMMTQGNYNNFRTWGPTRDTIVTRIIEATKL